MRQTYLGYILGITRSHERVRIVNQGQTTDFGNQWRLLAAIPRSRRQPSIGSPARTSGHRLETHPTRDFAGILDRVLHCKICKAENFSTGGRMSTATISSKGRVTIPKPVRERLGVNPGDRVDFVEVECGAFLLIAVNRDIRTLKGIVPKPERAVAIGEMKVCGED